MPTAFSSAPSGYAAGTPALSAACAPLDPQPAITTALSPGPLGAGEGMYEASLVHAGAEAINAVAQAPPLPEGH